MKMNSVIKAELPKVKYTKLSTEDCILSKLFIGKGMTVAELKSAISNLEYSVIRTQLIRMEDKGYVVRRTDNNETIYYLTAEGVAEAHYRLNSEVYLGLIDSLIEKGYPYGNVERFIKNRLYVYYLTGDWSEDKLIEQYAAWCDSNGLDLFSTVTKKLEK